MTETLFDEIAMETRPVLQRETSDTENYRVVCLRVALLAMSWLLCLPALAQDAAELLRQSGVRGGIVVHLGCGDGRQTVPLLANDRYLVHGLDALDENVDRARETVRAANLYGKVSVARFDGQHLPYVDNLVNLVIDSTGGTVALEEVLRVLAPGGVAWLDSKGGGSKGNASDVEGRKVEGQDSQTGTAWRKIVKAWPADIDEWTHFLHGPDNNAVARDRKSDIPRSIQWVAEPRWGRSHEEMAGMSAAVTAGGRIYYVVDEGPLASIRLPSRWTLIARDAFNGTLLWKKPMAGWVDPLRHFRSGPAHLSRRLTAVGDRVYVTLALDAPVVALDGATGDVLQEYADTARTEEILADDGVLYLLAGSSEVNRRGGGLYQRGEPAPADFRHVIAVHAASGKVLWKRDFSKQYVLPLTLAICGGQIYFQTTAGIVCLDAASGEDIWLTPRATPAQRMAFSAPTLVATKEVVLCADRDLGRDAEGQPAVGKVQWGVHGWNEAGFERKVKNTLVAYDAASGIPLWSTESSEGYNSPVDVFVIDDVVWVGSKFIGLDLKTGQPVGQMDATAPRVGMPHHRCYRNKATERFIFTGKSGIEVLSIEERSWLSNNSWIRGTCQYGIIPANGMLYAPPDACACFLTVKVPGFFAAAAQRDADGEMPFPDKPLIEQGSAFDTSGDALTTPDPQLAAADWPMYRQDVSRSGAIAATLPDDPQQQWTVALGGRLTQPVISGGRVFAASIDAHTVFARSAADGQPLWQTTAGGRIDSSPTIYQGRVYFGAADGWVYCLDAADGALVWRFRASPQERLIAAYGQLESIWPVHGSVLIQNDTLYIAAGRNSYLDGGIALYCLDPATGQERSKTVLYHLDSATGQQLVEEARFNMEGTTSDVLVGDGDAVYLKYFGFDRTGERIAAADPHLFSITGLLGEDWFVRSYWVLGAGMPGAGWGGWADAANAFPSGRILSFDDQRVYGYGRQQVAAGAVGHRADACHLFCMDRQAAAQPKPPAADASKKKRRAGQAKSKKPAALWSDPQSLIVRAMVLGEDRLAVAGPVDVGQKLPDILAYENEAEAVAGFEGRKGVYLRIVAAADGQQISETKLESLPVFDGLAAAGGRLYVSLKNGSLVCLGQAASTADAKRDRD